MSILLKVKTSIGGYFGGYTSVILDLEQGVYTCSHSLSEGKSIGDIDEDKKEYIVNMIDQLNLKNWKDSYSNNDIMDGTQWDAELIYDESTKSMFPVW